MTTVANPTRFATNYGTGIQNLRDMIEVAYNFDSGKHDHVLVPEFRGRTVQVDPDLMPCTMEDQATTLLCNTLARKLSKPIPASYFRHTDADIYELALNRHIGEIKKQQFMFRCHDDRVRAVVSDRYPAFGDDGIFENRLMLEALDRIASGQSGGHTLVRPHISRDSLVCKVVWKNFRDDSGDYGVGCAILNSEVGDGAFEVAALVQRHSCTNSIVFDVGHFNEGRKRIPHIGGTTKFRVALEELDVAMNGANTEATHWLNRLINSQAIVIRDMSAEIEKIAKLYKFDEATTIEIGIGTEGNENLFGLVNGITYAAHRVASTPEQMIEMERLGGQLLLEGTRRAERQLLRAV